MIEYHVQRGDTLWGLAERLLGEGTRWPEIYRPNAGLIDAELRGRGLDHNGPRDTLESRAPNLWIFPGQVLTLPDAASPDRETLP